MVGPAHLFLELHADGVGLLEEDGIAPQQVPQRCELVPLPLPEGPQCQLALSLGPLDCVERQAQLMGGAGLRAPRVAPTVWGTREGSGQGDLPRGAALGQRDRRTPAVSARA